MLRLAAGDMTREGFGSWVETHTKASGSDNKSALLTNRRFVILSPIARSRYRNYGFRRLCHGLASISRMNKIRFGGLHSVAGKESQL